MSLKGFCRRNPQPTAAAVTDCKSVYDIVAKTAPPQCEEHRTSIECVLIRQRMMENCKLRWVASGALLADCLTKAMDAGRLRECLKSGRYSLFDEQMVGLTSLTALIGSENSFLHQRLNLKSAE